MQYLPAWSVLLLGMSSSVQALDLKQVNVWEVIAKLLPAGETSSGSLPFQPPQDDGESCAGSFNITTYNIDGFPRTMGGNRGRDTRQISSILESLALDIVVFQEDFTKHEKLLSKLTTVTYPYRSKHFSGTPWTFGDGLARISAFPFDAGAGFARIQWNACGGDLRNIKNNPDCLTEKSFTMARTYLTADVTIDVYNLHQEAGGDSASLAAKRKNMQQLADYVQAHSVGHAVVVAGDFNLSWGGNAEHRQIMADFLSASGMQLACEVLKGGLDNCNDDPAFDKPDQIAFKSSEGLMLSPVSLEHLTAFGESNKLDPNGLSDHRPLTGQFEWQKTACE